MRVTAVRASVKLIIEVRVEQDGSTPCINLYIEPRANNRLGTEQIHPPDGFKRLESRAVRCIRVTAVRASVKLIIEVRADSSFGTRVKGKPKNPL